MYNKKSKQPHLAAANMPFTPMTHKIEKPAETPYRPLQLNDLATPKPNKSQSSAEKLDFVLPSPQFEDENDQPQPRLEKHHSHQMPKQKSLKRLPSNEVLPISVNTSQTSNVKNVQDPSNNSNNELTIIKNALYTCLHAVERLEAKQREEENTRKSYKDAQTQSSSASPPSQMGTKIQRKATPTQHYCENDNMNEMPSDKLAKKYVSRKIPKDDKPKRSDIDNDQIDDEKNLQEQMNAMVALLNRMKNQIDKFDSSNQK